jgi:hypothetical protein
MPSLADIANQVNNKLTSIQNNTADTANVAGLIKGDTADLKIRLDDVNKHLDAINTTNQVGFSNLSNGLFAILEAQRTVVAQLESAIHQRDAIICWLTKLAGMMCEQLRESERQTAVGRSVHASLATVEGILELANATEYVQYQRTFELGRRMAECCPPDEVAPEPCFQPCDAPEIVRREPKGQDWQPLTPVDERRRERG